MLSILVGALVLAAACGENLTHPDPLAPADPTSLPCLPDLDGTITARELPVAVGVEGTYLVSSSERTVSLTGTVGTDGRRRWDFTAPTVSASGDTAVTFTARPVADYWFASSFPGADLAVPLDKDATIIAVYHRDDAALWLHGLASADENPAKGKTLLAYDAPIPALRFPLADGTAWTARGEITSGTLDGLPYVGHDDYDIHVDGAGRVDLPDWSFTQALRVRTHITQSPAAGAPVTRRQTQFIFECFGEVARAQSKSGEPAEDFTTAAEVRRRAP